MSAQTPNEAIPMSDENLLAYVQAEEQRGKPFVTSTGVKEAFDIGTNEGARKRLEKLVDRGDLRRKRIGARAVVYWREGVTWIEPPADEATQGASD